MVEISIQLIDGLMSKDPTNIVIDLTEDKMSNIVVYPSEWKLLDKTGFTHVVWFNK